MKAYNQVLGLPWFKARNPEIDWAKGWMTALPTPNGQQRVQIPEVDRICTLPERCEENTNDEPPPDIQHLGTTSFGHPSVSEEVVETFSIRLGDCQGWWEQLCKASPKVRETPGCGMRKQGERGRLRQKSDTVMVLRWLLPAVRDRKGGTGEWWCYIPANRLIELSRDPYPSPLCQIRYNANKANENRNRHI